MVFVRISETYDLSTKVNKMGMVGIHTPKSELVKYHYGGLIQNFKYARFVSCDVALACASMLPADPLQIGVEAGSIAPQDMFNPILYKAVSNESMSNILGYIEGTAVTTAAVDKNSVRDVNDTDFKQDQFNMYYALLSDDLGWRKAMPQAGLMMRGLFPMVYSVLANTAQPLGNSPTNWYEYNTPNNLSDGANVSLGSAKIIRGHGVRMPRFPTVKFTNIAGRDAHYMAEAESVKPTSDDMDTSCYVGLIILPPAKLNQLFYRLKVTWTIEFTELRSIADIARWNFLDGMGASSYATDYATQSKAMSNVEGMVDTAGADITKVV